MNCPECKKLFEEVQALLRANDTDGLVVWLRRERGQTHDCKDGLYSRISQGAAPGNAAS
jgi:hypothetical protein